MSNARLIKQRIQSAKNIAKITKAMEMVSASKMRRAQDQVQASRPYSDRLSAILHNVGAHTDPGLHPLLSDNQSGLPALVVISTDRGLCGGLNTNLFKKVVDYHQVHPTLTTIVVGKKAQEFVSRIGLPVYASFTGLPERVGLSDVLPITKLIMTQYLDGTFSRVDALHMEFVNTLSQQARETQILPLDPGENVADAAAEYQFEPSAQDILNSLLPYYIESQLYQLVLDAKASEHSARMIAMQSASNNAKDVMGSLQLEYNKSRQAGITQELIEITTAGMALQS